MFSYHGIPYNVYRRSYKSRAALELDFSLPRAEDPHAPLYNGGLQMQEYCHHKLTSVSELSYGYMEPLICPSNDLGHISSLKGIGADFYHMVPVIDFSWVWAAPHANT